MSHIIEMALRHSYFVLKRPSFLSDFSYQTFRKNRMEKFTIEIREILGRSFFAKELKYSPENNHIEEIKSFKY